MRRSCDSAAYYRRRAAEERAKAARAPNESIERLHLELADILAERASIAEQAGPPGQEPAADA